MRQITIDDSYTVIRSSNSISDAIQGVTIDLQSTSATNVSLNITRDSEEIITSVETFVESYNELLSSMSKLKEGDLSGDGTLRLVETQVRSVLGSNASVTGAYSYASDIGISFQKDGTLTFDRNKLTDAMQDDLTSVAELFANDDQGFAFRLDAKLTGMLGDDGLIDAREEGLNASVDNNNKEIAVNATPPGIGWSPLSFPVFCIGCLAWRVAGDQQLCDGAAFRPGKSNARQHQIIDPY